MSHSLIIDQNFNDSDEIQQFLQDLPEKFTAVSIFGPQSSGKSTLLNDLFLTNLDTLKLSTPRAQTTRGVIAVSSGHNLIFDVEGTDSRERRFQQQHVSEKFAAFACSIGDVFIVNIWEHDIGRYEASGYSILEKVFSIFSRKIKLQRTGDNRVNMIFCIRDAKITDKDRLGMTESQIKDDVVKIWKDQTKYNFDDCFKIEFSFLAHREYQRDLYNIGIQELRNQLNSQNSVNEQVPKDLRSTYFKNLWHLVSSDEELDLNKEMQLMKQLQFEKSQQKIIKKFQNFVEEQSFTIELTNIELSLMSSVQAFQVNSKVGQLYTQVSKLDFTELENERNNVIQSITNLSNGLSEDFLKEFDFQDQINNICQKVQTSFILSIYKSLIDSFQQINDMFYDHINMQIEEGELTLTLEFIFGLTDLYQIFKVTQSNIKQSIEVLQTLQLDLTLPFADQLSASINNLSSLYMLKIETLDQFQKLSIAQLYIFFFEMIYTYPILVSPKINYSLQFDLQNELEAIKNKFTKFLISGYFKTQKEVFYKNIKKDIVNLMQNITPQFYQQLQFQREKIIIQFNNEIQKSFSDNHIVFVEPSIIGISSAFYVKDLAIYNYFLNKSEGLVRLIGSKIYIIKQLSKHYNAHINEILVHVIQNYLNRIVQTQLDNKEIKQSILGLQSGILSQQTIDGQLLEETQISISSDVIDPIIQNIDLQTSQIAPYFDQKQQQIPKYIYFLILFFARNDIKTLFKHKFPMLICFAFAGFLYVQFQRGKKKEDLARLFSYLVDFVKSYLTNDPDQINEKQKIFKNEFERFIK